ncbi:MAG: hypothetical protein QM489_01090 [Candidatus Izemoplasma sp.]
MDIKDFEEFAEALNKEPLTEGKITQAQATAATKKILKSMAKIQKELKTYISLGSKDGAADAFMGAEFGQIEDHLIKMINMLDI